MDLRTGLAVAVLGVVLVASYLLMWRGWRRRAARFSELPSLPSQLPAAELLLGPLDGTYMGTTTAGDWLDRVAAHGLGGRSAGSISVTGAGLVITRAPEPSLPIPAVAVTAVRVDRAAAGRAVRHPEYLIVTWRHADHVLDTAFRPHHREDLGRLVAATEPLATHEMTP